MSQQMPPPSGHPGMGAMQNQGQMSHMSQSMAGQHGGGQMNQMPQMQGMPPRPGMLC